MKPYGEEKSIIFPEHSCVLDIVVMLILICVTWDHTSQHFHIGAEKIMKFVTTHWDRQVRLLLSSEDCQGAPAHAQTLSGHPASRGH